MRKQLPLNFILILSAFILGSTLWSLLVWGMRNKINEQLVAEEQKSFENASLILQEKLESYIHGLQGMGGFMMASGYKTDLKGARRYAEFRHFFTNFPGALGFGFIKPVSKEKLSSHVSDLKKQAPNFKYRKLDGTHHESFIIEFIEPIEKNSNAQGLDVATEARRLTAAIEARDTGRPALTAPIQLVQFNGKGFGFLYFLPIYDLPSPPTSIKDKRAHFVGWSFAPIQSDAVMSHLKERTDLRLSFNLDDITQKDKIIPIFKMITEIDENKSTHEKVILVGGRV